MIESKEVRIIVIDNDPAIHRDFNNIYDSQASHFTTSKTSPLYTIQSEYECQAGLETIKIAKTANKPFALAYIDSRALNVVETMQRIWSVDPEIQLVIYSTNSDYTWAEISQNLKKSDDFLILNKPLDVNEIQQITTALVGKWELKKRVQKQLEELQSEVEIRTKDLEVALQLTKATLESTPEGTVVIGNNQNIIINNEKFLKIWHLSNSDLQNENAISVFEKLSNQVEESKLFCNMIDNLLTMSHTINSVNEWKLKNGKVIELYMQPYQVRDKLMGAVLSFRDVTDRRRLEDQLVYQATHDSLTSLPNRILLADRIQQGIAHAKREDTYLSVLMIDLDNFKEVNDNLGHAAGDTLLKLVANRLSASVREIDTVIRLGGDEFVVILMSQNRAEDSIIKAKELIEKIIIPFQIEDHSITITASIGISYYPDDGQDANALLKNADAALYHAKKMGRNTFQVYMYEYNEQLLQRAELTSGLLEAIEKNEFVLHYQPLVKPDTGGIMGLEALVRWQHPKLGLLFPQTFISLAEETGLIVLMGDWVLKAACTQIKIWQTNFNPDLTIAVNISGYQFAQKNFVEKVQSVLVETGINPTTLELEMSQNYIFRNISETAQKMLKLKELGVRLSIDGFGVGDASFSYLKYFPFDKVKIDKSYIKGIHTNKYDEAIVEAIISMTKKIGMEVIASGVENAQQVEFLTKYHGHQVQGYYYSSPLDTINCTELLKSKKSLIEKY